MNMRWIVLSQAAMNEHPTPSASSGQALATKIQAWRRWGTLCLLAALALHAEARTRPHYGGTLRVEMEGDAWQQNVTQAGGLGGPMARRLIFDGLTRVDLDGTVRPSLAVRWTSENSDRRWQFWLRPGVHFQDGSPLNVAVVATSLTGSCGAACPWTAVRAVGSSVVFTSDSPMPNLPTLLAGDDFSIVHFASTGADAAPQPTPLLGSFVGTGAFEAVGFSSGVLTLMANDSCWEGRPFLDKIEVTGHKSIRDQWLDLSLGRADLVEVPAEQLRQAREQRLTVVVSGPASLLTLAVADGGVLSDANLRAAIALAVDRSSLSNVIFQKQGEITASLLPAALTGYGFLFPADRDVNKARELRGGLTPPALTISTDGGAQMQLASQRIALNLREAGFNVQVAPPGPVHHADMVLLRLTLASNQPQAALESLLRGVGVGSPVVEDTSAGLYKVEREFLQTHTLVPLLYLPRAYALGGRVRDLSLSADGMPLLADVSLQDAP
jgi:MarR-like DNA-binding transcriptional regulator SgrR of sgrS sRNA